MAILNLEQECKFTHKPKPEKTPPIEPQVKEPEPEPEPDKESVYEVHKFNMQLGARFKCGICGATHQAADNAPARRCLYDMMGELKNKLKYRGAVFNFSYGENNSIRIDNELFEQDSIGTNMRFFFSLLFIGDEYIPDGNKHRNRKLEGAYKRIEKSITGGVVIPIMEFRQALVYKTRTEREIQVKKIIEKYLDGYFNNYDRINAVMREKIKLAMINLGKNKNRVGIKPYSNDSRNEKNYTRIEFTNKAYKHEKPGEFGAKKINSVYFNDLSSILSESRSMINDFNYKILYDKYIVYLICCVGSKYSVFMKRTPDKIYAPIILPEKFLLKKAIPMCRDKWIELK